MVPKPRLLALLLLVLSLSTPLFAAQDTFLRGTLDAADEAVRLNMPGAGSVAFQVTGTYSGTITFEASVDGSTFVAVPAVNMNSGAKATTTTGTGIFVVHGPGARYVRARMSAIASGAAVVSGNASIAPLQAGSLGTSTAGATDTELAAAAAFDANNGNIITDSTHAYALFHVYDATLNRMVAIRAANNMTDAAAGGTLLPSAQVIYGGATFQRLRTPTVFKTVALGAGTTETTIWDPDAGKKFRLMGFALTAGAASTLTFWDGTGLATVFVARGGTDVPVVVNLGNGILSGADDRLLTVERGTSATLTGTVWGTEED